ncbi:MAG: cache domain-containing protein [Bacteroidales bacterium]
MRIRAKIFLFIFVTSFVIFTLVIAYIAFNYRKYSINQANRLVKIYALNAANSVKATLDNDLSICNTLAQSFAGYRAIPADLRDPIYNDMLKNVLNSHPEYLSVWMSWELRFIKPGYTANYGRKRTVAVREAGIIRFVVDTAELDGDNIGGLYYNSKITKNDVLADPYFYVYSPHEGGDSVLETSIAKPLILNGEFGGIVGIDITLNRFQHIIDETQPFKDSYALLVSNNGTIISSHNPELQGDSLLSTYPVLSKFNILPKIKEGKPDQFNITDSAGISSYVAIAPIFVGKSETPWAICLVVPSKIIQQESITYFNTSIIIGSIGIFLFSLITLLIARRLTLPLKQTTSILKDLDKGIIDTTKKVKVRSNDELAEMGKSLNNLLDTLSKTAEFAKKIGEGDFNANYTPLSKSDVLGNTLVEMQKNLRIGQEQEEIRQLERMKLNWAQDGLSQLGEVLRTSTDNFEEYLYVILGHIINYIKADQGGIFILNTHDKDHAFLELLASYAYNKKKAMQAQFEIGESLVGRCFQEKEMIYMTNLPEGYTFVSSGLGSYEPKCLFLMPLIFEDEPFGVIEMASFREFADYEIEFLKSIGERVASSISIMQKNVQTRKLLDQFQIRSDELSKREQLLQDTFQELQKSQEEGMAKEKENEGILDSVVKIGSVIWYNIGGTVVNVKNSGILHLGLKEKDLIGKNHSEFEPEAKTNIELYKKFWSDLKEGISKQRPIRRKTDQGDKWLMEYYTPVKDRSGAIYRIICMITDITELNQMRDEIERLRQQVINLSK